MSWDTRKKASYGWIVLGLIGVGQIVALIYSLISKNDKDRVFGVLFLLGWLGDIIIYVIEKDKDKYLATMALYLLIGNIILVAAIFIALGAYSFILI